MKHGRLSAFLHMTCLLLTIVSCKNESKTVNKGDKNKVEAEEKYVEVRSTGMNFDMPDKLPSGWTNFKYINESNETHFFILEKMPDTLGLFTYRKEIFPPFKAAFSHMQEGNMEAAIKALENIPDWFFEVGLAGGVGLVSAGRTAKSYIHLEPGKYVMECYVRMPNGVPHVFSGMIKEVIVTNEKNNIKPPQASAFVSVSSSSGITIQDTLSAGNHIIAVKFEDQKHYEHLLGHDVNLVQIENDSLIPVLAGWLNTVDMKAFRTPAPAGMKFLGGVEDLDEGKTGYFEASLDKGKYVLISEIPNAVERGMVQYFEIQ